MYQLLPLLCLFGLSMLSACERADPDGPLPQKIKDEWKKRYPDADRIKDWEVDGNGYYEVRFKNDGDKLRADFTHYGQWIETEQTIDYKDLPKAIKEAIKGGEYDKDDIDEIERTDHYRKGLFYDVEFEIDGKKIDVEYRENGERL